MIAGTEGHRAIAVAAVRTATAINREGQVGRSAELLISLCADAEASVMTQIPGLIPRTCWQS